MINYKNLSADGGWGLISVIGLILIGIFGLVLDFAIQIVIGIIRKNREQKDKNRNDYN